MNRPSLVALFVLLWSGGALAAPATDICHLPGHADPLRCLRVDVPLDYADRKGERLALHVTLAPSFRATPRPDPLFVLAGGPGQAGSDIAFLLDQAFERVRATRDIVLIDQRGTGRSGRLSCENLRGLDLQPQTEIDRRVASCIQSLGRPFRQFNTANAARDIDEVRKALGYATLNVWGGSYGTRLAQVYARQFPGRVRSLILDAVAAPGQIIGLLGRDPQLALEAMFRRCEQDPGCRARYPALRERFTVLDASLSQAGIEVDIRHPRTAENVSLQLSHARFVEAIRAALYVPQFAARLPFILDQASAGNWQPFAAHLAAQADFSADSMAIGTTLAVLCGEDLAHVTPQMASEEASLSFLQGSFLSFWRQGCPLVDVPTVARASPSLIAAPALLLSGALDPVTPPSRAEAAARYMPRAQHVIAGQVGHGVSHLGCAPRLLRAFLDAPEQKVDAACLNAIPAPSMMLGAAGPQP